MPADKPKFAQGYAPTAVGRVHTVLLFIASKLGDLMDDSRIERTSLRHSLRATR